MNLVLEGKTVRAVEAKALDGIDPNFGTPAKRRNLIRLAIRDGKCCAHCGDPVYFKWERKSGQARQSKAKMATFDHIVTAQNGGTYALENGLLACYDCNNLRGNMKLETFQKKIAAGDWEPRSIRKERKLRKKAKREAKRIENQKKPAHQFFIFKLGYLLYLIAKRDKYLHENIPSQSLREERVLQNTSHSTVSSRNTVCSTADAGSSVRGEQRNFGSMGDQSWRRPAKRPVDDLNRLISPKSQIMVDA